MSALYGLNWHVQVAPYSSAMLSVVPEGLLAPAVPLDAVTQSAAIIANAHALFTQTALIVPPRSFPIIGRFSPMVVVSTILH